MKAFLLIVVCLLCLAGCDGTSQSYSNNWSSNSIHRSTRTVPSNTKNTPYKNAALYPPRKRRGREPAYKTNRKHKWWHDLDSVERNQYLLERYKVNEAVELRYERYIAYLKESTGWSVRFIGSLRDGKTVGRDLVCTNGSIIEYVKPLYLHGYWGNYTQHIRRLRNTVDEYKRSNRCYGITSVLVTPKSLSSESIQCANELGVRVEQIQLRGDYPMIKCTLGGANNDGVYHLPYDQRYDYLQMNKSNKRYVETVMDADALGCRKAMYHGYHR